MKFTKNKILIEQGDIKNIIIVNDKAFPSEKDSIAFVWSDNISNPSKKDDFVIDTKDGFSVNNLGFRIGTTSKYVQSNIIPHIKEGLNIASGGKYGNEGGYIGNIKDVSSFPVPKEIILTKNQLIEFKTKMKK